jgi:hypothetical protein
MNEKGKKEKGKKEEMKEGLTYGRERWRKERE